MNFLRSMEEKMSFSSIVVVLLAATLLLTPAAGGGGGDAEVSSSQQSPSCLSPLLRLMPCLPYLRNISVMAPRTDCCRNFNSVLAGNQSLCLCHAITSSGNFTRIIGGTIDQGRMYALPFRCGTAVPSVFLFITCYLNPLPHLAQTAAVPVATALPVQN